MPNEAIRLPSVEVSSSVHYQKTIAVSKTLSLVAGPSWSEQNSGRNPAKLAHAQTALQGLHQGSLNPVHCSCSGSGVLIPKSASSPSDAMPLPMLDE